ncbi:MAG TPA: DUF4336 domain-containing protein [Acetobacteraceae bacterium]|nr:DUF4336 domain-containing protein [Acetobacteraceae bacterium]
MIRDGTYPPLGVLKPVAEGVWIVDDGMRHLGLPFPIRMTVVRLPDGGVWLHSPTPFSGALDAALRAIGAVRHLVAPDTAHWSHIPAWQARHPDAVLWGVPGLAERAARKGAALRFDRVLEEAPPDAWSGVMEHAMFRFPGFAELAFFHPSTATLILTDTVQAMDPARMPLRMRLLLRVAGSAAPEGGTPRYLRWLLRRRVVRAANRAAAEKLIALAPARVLFAHGASYEGDGTARLRRAFAWALRP